MSCATLMPDPIISPSVVVTILDHIDHNAPPWRELKDLTNLHGPDNALILVFLTGLAFGAASVLLVVWPP